jgi:hypothetical protein
MIFNDGEWVYFDQQDGGKVYTSQPQPGSYAEGDLWILAYGESYGEYTSGSILKANGELEWIDATPDTTTTITNIKESFMWDDNGIKVMKRVTDDDGKVTNPFYVSIDSTRMGFHSVDANGNDVEVVHIGNNSSTIQNATFEGGDGTTFENSAQFNAQVNFGKFVWKVENNGSLSLAISN